MLPGEIVALVERSFGVAPGTVCGKSRKTPAVRARFAAAWVLAHRGRPVTLRSIAVNVGQDHSSVNNALKRVDAIRSREPAFAAQTDALVVAVCGGLPLVRKLAAKIPDRVDVPLPPPIVSTARKAKNALSDDDCDARKRHRGTVALGDALRAALREREAA